MACSMNSQLQEMDFTFFIKRLRSVDHLPELVDSHTAMSSTWDRRGRNRDGTDFKRIEGSRNILLDVKGPGCIHRLFTGRLADAVEDTRIQIFLDHSDNPLFDMKVNEFFDYENGPFPYPLVFHKTYPGILFPFPFEKHCKVQLVNDQGKNWGNFWQVTWTKYKNPNNIKSLTWPLNSNEKKELKRTVDTWLTAESTAPMPPTKWSVDRKISMEKDSSYKIDIPGCGIIREMRISLWPPEPHVLKNIHMQMYWDGKEKPSVDVPLGYFFGNGDYGINFASHYSTLVLGLIPNSTAYSRFPMPFNNDTLIQFENKSGIDVRKMIIQLDIQKMNALPENFGRFHVTWTEDLANRPESAKYMGHSVHKVLERHGVEGKYVGVLLQVHWPSDIWWGEGDWMIWTDEDSWPPSYHGTGSEEYFNSGWANFDRKAISGFIKMRPGDVCVYSFHLNDAFQFNTNIRVAQETWIYNRIQEPPVWGSTAYWYADSANEANSRQDFIQR